MTTTLTPFLKPIEFALNKALAADPDTQAKLSAFDEHQITIHITDLNLMVHLLFHQHVLRLSTGDNDDADFRPLPADALGGLDSTDTRHVDIHQDHIDFIMVLTTLFNRRFTAVDLGNNLDALLCRKQAGETAPDQVVVIDNHDADV